MAPVNEADLDWSPVRGESDGSVDADGTADADEERVGAATQLRRKQLGAAAGNEQLGCSLYELPPGERSWPYHYHTANEEALYVLAGEGRLRIAGEEHAVSAGDYAAFPADESGAHRMINETDAPLRYLVFSTMTEPDVIEYPDLGTIGVFAGTPPGGDGERSIEGYYRAEETVEYWTGEKPDAEDEAD